MPSPAEPGGPVAAVIVEGSRYAYAYGSVAPKQEHGLQQVGAWRPGAACRHPSRGAPVGAPLCVFATPP